MKEKTIKKIENAMNGFLQINNYPYDSLKDLIISILEEGIYNLDEKIISNLIFFNIISSFEKYTDMPLISTWALEYFKIDI